MSASKDKPLTPSQARITVAFGIAKGWVKLPIHTLSEREVDSILADQTRLRYKETKLNYRRRQHAALDASRTEGV